MDSSFRTLQAVNDLVHHVKPLLAQHLAAASDLTLPQTGEAFRTLRDDGFRFQCSETIALLDGLETIAIQQGEGFDLAVVVLLADALQRRVPSGQLAEAWGKAGQRLRDWPATLRAAVANGLVRAEEVDLIRLTERPSPADCLTLEAATIAEPLLRIARSMRPDEMMSVAEADRGNDVEQHYQALRVVIGQHDGLFLPEEDQYPAEVVKLRSHSPADPGFAGCTAILLLNALKSNDHLGWFETRWEKHGAAYCALQPSRRDPILAGVRYLYETDQYFSVDVVGRLGIGATIPVVDDL